MELSNDSGTTPAENGSQDSQSQNDGTTNQPQFVTVDQLNRAITGHNKRMETQLTKTLDEKLSSFSSLIDSLKNTEEVKSEPSKTPPSTGNNEILKLQKQLEDMQKALSKSDTEKQEATNRAREERIKSEVLSSLTALKVERGEQVYRLVRDAIEYDEDSGKAKMRVFDSSIGFDDVKDLQKGLAEWLNNEGQHFLPPRNVGGSGASNKSGSQGNRTRSFDELHNMSPAELRKVDLKDYIPEHLLNGYKKQ